MKIHHVILALCILLIPMVCAVNYDDKNTLESIVTIGNSFTLSPTGDSYSIKFVNASLSAYPGSDARQSVLELTTDPEAELSSDGMCFMFRNPEPGTYDILITSRIVTSNVLDEVKLPVNFPLANLDSSLYTYIAPTDIIDVTPEIKNLASELIGDKTDLYEIEYSFSEYVRKNIAYDLSTLTSDANQKSSWVLDNKRGVCDEITNLFISLNRAAGIPTRFVSGIAYTNLDDVFGESWVPHAWAEVYFPGYGWVPYDVTYGEYGFIDAGHIKLIDSSESSSSDINYNYLGYDVRLVPGDIDIDVNVVNYGEDSRGRYDFVAKIYSDEVGFGSYDILSVDVANPRGYYQVADLYLADTQGMTVINDADSTETVLNKTVHRKHVLLKPYGESTVYWIIQVDPDLDRNFIYTLPITVYNTYNETSTSFLQSKKGFKSLSYDFCKDFIGSRTDESVKPYSRNIYLECSSDKNAIYLEDFVNIDCVLDNKGDKSFDEVTICIDDECSERSLAVQKILLNYTKHFGSEGLKNVEIKAYSLEYGKEFTKVSYTSVNVLDKPKIEIIDLAAPDMVNYKDSFDITFTITKVSQSSPKNLKLVMTSETNKVEWTFPEFDGDKEFTVKSTGSSMKPNKNTYLITVYYEDEAGNAYSSEKSFIINSKATFLENMLLYVNLVGRSIEQVFTG